MGVLRTTVSALALAAGVVAAGTARADVMDYLGKPVASVRLVIGGRETTDASLTDVVETKVGRPLSMAQVRESITHLMTLGRFEHVLVDATLDRAGVALRYDLSPVHPVTKIQFKGTLEAPGVDQGQLRQTVIDRYGASPAAGRVDDVRRLVERTLQESGYLHANVVPHTEIEHSPERATLVLTIDPGTRTRIGTVDVVPAESAPALKSQLRLSPGAPYEKAILDGRIDRYVEGLHKRGYYEAKVVTVPHFADDEHVANLTVTVTPGPRVRVVFSGDSLPAVKREELVPIKREGSADEDLLEDSTNRIEEYLRGEGFRDAVAPHAREASNDELLITFNIKKGLQYRVQHVEISGNASIPLSDFEPSLRLRDGQPFSAEKLYADVATIAGVYRRRGFADVKVDAPTEPVALESGAPHQSLLVRINITEGARTLVESVRFEGNQSIPDTTLREGLSVDAGRPLTVAQLTADRDAIQLRYANSGYRAATVDPVLHVSADRTRADVVFTVREGPRIFVDHVLIVGNVRTSERTILRALQIKPGDPLGLEAVVNAKQRLASLGLFRRTDIAELRHGSENRRDLVVTIEEAPVTTIGGGGGGEVLNRPVRRAEANGIATERLEFAPRASFQIGRRNLFGKNRSVDLFTSASLHPKDSPVFAGQTTPPSDTAYGFTQYRVVGTYREPRLFDTGADAFVTSTLEQQIRSSFNFARRGANAGIARHLTHNVSISGSYQIQRTRLFDQSIDPKDQLDIDKLFAQVLLSSFLASGIRDTRDDPVDPKKGAYLSANGQLAARAIGSEVGFAKSFFTAQLFRPLPRSDGVVFAGQARLGLAAGFPRPKDSLMYVGERPTTVTVTIEDLPISERFFAGGDTTVRGFVRDGLGIHHNPPQPTDTIINGFPNGGNGLVIFNAELRAPVKWNVGVVGFLDSGNVFAHVRDIDLAEMRGSVGFGLRYKSPIGPLRFDWGFKLHRDEIASGVREGRSEIWISFGQAF